MDTEKYPSLQAGEPGEPVGVSLRAEEKMSLFNNNAEKG